MPQDPPRNPAAVAAAVAAAAARAARTTARRRAVAGGLGALAGGIVLLVLGVAADAAADLPAGVRAGLGLAGTAGAAAVGAVLAMVALRRAPAGASARRLAEEALGDGDRRLTAAGELAAMDGVLAGRGAVRLIGGLPLDRLESALPGIRWRAPTVVAGGAVAVLAGLALVLPGLLAAVVPRFTDPWGDHPPWALIRLRWVEAPAQARDGEAARMVVAVDGAPPAGVVFHLEPEGGGAAAIDGLPDGDGRWNARVAADAGDVVVWAAAGGTRTVRHRLRRDPAPILRRAEAILVSPPYAQLDPERQAVLPGSPARFRALAGSAVVARPEANRPLVAVHTVPDGRRIALVDGGALLPDPATGSLAVLLEAPDGALSKPVLLAEIERRLDEPPRVLIRQPDRDAVAPPGTLIPVVAEAEDDLGLAGIARTIEAVPAGSTRGRVIERAEDSLGGTGDTWRGSVSTRTLRVGEDLVVTMAVRDTAPPTGQWSGAAVRRIRIIDGALYNALVREQVQATALAEKYRPLLDEMARIQSEGASAGGATAAALARQASALAAKLAALRRDDPLFAAEPQLQSAMAEELAALERALAAGGPAGAGASAAAMQQDLDRLTAQAMADGLDSAVRDLAKAQRSIADEMQRLATRIRGPAEEARLRDLAAQERQVAQAVEDLRQAADEVAAAQERAGLGEDAARTRALGGFLERSEAERLTRQAAGQTLAGRERAGAADAQEAARRLEQAAAQGCRGGSCSSGWCDGESLGSCRAQLASIFRRGFGRGGGPLSGGGGGAGMAGLGSVVRAGGMPFGQDGLQVYGPEVLASIDRPGAGTGTGDGRARDSGFTIPAHGDAAANGYARGVRRTSAGAGAVLTPAEERLVQDYFRRLAGETPER